MNSLTKLCVKSNRLLRRFQVSFHLNMLSKTTPRLNKDDILLFSVVRNEELRLPYFIEYYSSLGINHMFFIDNGSQDNTLSLLKNKNNIHVFETKKNYLNQHYWIDNLLCKFGKNHWCLIVDADEFLVFPDCEKIKLSVLCRYLDQFSYNALDCTLLDMYSDKAIKDTIYNQGDPPFLITPYFDTSHYESRGPWTKKKYFSFPGFIYQGIRRLWGGMRKRIFDIDCCVSKFPLIKFHPNMHLSQGCHFLQKSQVADISGALLHFKYFQDFHQRVSEEVIRGQHWNQAVEYHSYAEKLKTTHSLSLHAKDSARYESSKTLVDNKIIKKSKKFENFSYQFSEHSGKEKYL
jgi:glycosyl transferase family 2